MSEWKLLPQPKLTKREIEVLKLLSGGNTDLQIATTLTVTRNTVRAHIRNVLTTLQVHSREDAILRASRLGLI